MKIQHHRGRIDQDTTRSAVLDSPQGRAQRALRVRINAAREKKHKPILHIRDRILTEADVKREIAK